MTDELPPSNAGPPVRLQLSRRAGFDLQHHSRRTNGLPAVNVARPSRWGNPYVVGATSHCGVAFSRGALTVDEAVSLHRGYILLKLEDAPGWLEPLRGKNLACFCPLAQPCHADALLEFANRLVCEEGKP